jgi:membrane-associated phospholipid phosphatase
MVLLGNGEQVSFSQHMLYFDYRLFTKINRQWVNPFLDSVMPFLRQAEVWMPFYLFLLVFATINFSKKGWLWCACLGMTAIISDLVSSGALKQLVFRYRPCSDPEISQYVRLLVKYCPQSSSFTSSHACNHFSAAMFIFLTMKHTSRWWQLVFLWAFCISYAQIYVGVHYPLDVAAGMILGCAVGYGMSLFFNKRIGILRKE